MTSTAKADRNVSLDALRTLALVGVVSIHASSTQPDAGLAYWFNEIPRFAVPAYFMLSAYFWRPEELQRPGLLVRRVALRVIPAFLLWTAIYLVAEALRDPAALADRLAPKQLIVMLWTGGAGYHLWFLPAVFVGTALVAFSIKWLGWRTTILWSALAYALGTLVGAYSHLLDGQLAEFLAKNARLLTRNGVFMAPLFLMSGILLRRHREVVEKLPLLLVVMAVALFGALHIAEGYFVLGYRHTGHVYAFATYFYGVAVFALFMKLQLRGRLWTSLGIAGFTAYLVHLLLLQVLVTDLHLALPLPVTVVLVSAASLAAALAIGAVRALVQQRLSPKIA